MAMIATYHRPALFSRLRRQPRPQHTAASRIVFYLFALLLLTGSKGWGQVTLPHLDAINYTVGQGLQTQTNWTTLNSGDALLIASGNLSYSGLAASFGNKVTFDGAGIDAAKLFTQQTSGTIYYSFLLNVTNVSSLTAAGYFTGFNEGTGTNFGATVWTRIDGAGYDIGLDPRTTAPTTAWTTGTTSINTTLFIVVSYQIVSGTSNDVVKLWVNPTPGAAEPAATLSITNTGTDLTNINRILIRQDAVTKTPYTEMDELRVGTTWASVTPAASCSNPTITTTGTAASVTYNASSQNTTLAYTATTNSPTSFSIDWDATANTAGLTDQGSTSYAFNAGGGTMTGIVIQAGVAAGTYSGTMTITNAGGCTATQAISLTINPAACTSQTITFGALPTKTYGDADFAPGATASSGLTVSYTSSNTSVATIVSGNIHIVGAGTSTITASQAGDATYCAAPNAQQTLTVNKKALTISAPTIASKIYNGSATTGSVTPGTLSGLVGSETLNVSATGVYADANVGTGKTATVTYTLSNGTGLAANYSLANGTGTGNITAKALTITANDVSHNFGTTITGGAGSTAFTSSGLAGAETIGSVTIAYGTGASATDAIGTYAGQVTASAATGGTFTASNYTITYVAGTITVTAAPCLTEGFESGLNSAGYVTGGNSLTLGSGDWTFNESGLRSTNKHSGTYGCQIKDGSSYYAATPNVSGCSYVTFWFMSSTAPTVKYGTTTYSTTQIASSGSWYQYRATINSGTVNKIYFYNSSGSTGYLDDVEVFCSTDPILSASPLAAFGNVCINTTSGPNSFTITGSNLTTADISVAALSGYTYSTSSGGSYTPTLTLTHAAGSYSQVVYVKFTPTAIQAYSGNIVVSGGGAASSVNCAASGSGVNSAPTISAGTAGSITSSAASITGNTISALGCSSVTAYGVEYSTTSGFANGAGTPVAGSGFSGSAGGTYSSSLSGLIPNTTYYFHAYATNGGGTAYSSQGSFTTTCSAVNIPYSETFDGVTQPAIPNCMVVTNNNSDSYEWVTCTATSLGNLTSITPHSGANQMGMDYSTTVAMNDWFFTPGLNLINGTTYRLSFWIKGYSDTYTEKLEVKYGTSAAAASMTSGTLYTNTSINLADFPSYTQITADFTPTSSGVFYIGFHGYSDADQTYIFIDDIGVQETTIKLEPTNYPTDFATTCASATSNSIPLTWTAAAAGTTAPDGYLIKWSGISYSDIAAPADGTFTADGTGAKNIVYGTNNYTVNGLTQNTTYYFKIWTYTNSGTNVNYKLGSEPQAFCATIPGPCLEQLNFTATPSGWSATSVTYASNEAVFGSTTGALATIEIANPTSLTFDLRRTDNTSAKTLYVEVSTTGQAGTYAIAGTYTHGNTTSDGTTHCTVDLSAYNSSNIWLKFRKASSTTSPWYIKNVSVLCGVCSEPTSNSLGLTLSNITNTTMDFTIGTPGNGNKRIIIAKEGSAVNYTPVDNTTYVANSFSASTDYSGNRIVYNGTGTTGSIGGLTPGTTYYFKVFEYNCAASHENYYLGGTILEGSATTSISPVTGLDVICQTATSADISWVAPEGSYDGVIIGMRQSTNPCHVLNGDASTYGANGTYSFSTGYQYGIADPPSSYIVYKGTGTSVTVTGLTAGASYTIKAYTYKNSTTWSATQPTTSIASLGTPPVSSVALSPQNTKIQVTWANPASGCFDEVFVIASASSVTASPSGNGVTPAYSANSVFATSGTDANLASGQYCVYRGTANSVTVTGLTNGTSYCFKVFTRKGSTWSTGVEASPACTAPIATAAAMVPGSIAVLGVCSQVQDCNSGYSNGDDEISIVTFNDIAVGTSFDMTDNGYSRCTDGLWGNAEGYLRIRRTGSPLPKGTVITFRLKNLAPYFEGIYPDNNWAVDIRYGSLILNTSGDQIYFMTGGAWNNGTTGSNNATYTGGTFLFAFNTNDLWQAGVCSSTTYPSNSSGTGASQNSGLYPRMECFNMMPGIATDYIKFKLPLADPYYNGTTTLTQRQWIELLNDAANWELFPDCNDYYDDAVNDFTSSATSISIATSGGLSVTPGVWTGAAGDDWFDCLNWDDMLIPDQTVDVSLPSSATNDCRIGDPSVTIYHYTEASCHNITNDLPASFAFKIGTNDANSSTTESNSKLHVYGDFTNNKAFTHSAGSVTFKGATTQAISGSVAPTFSDLVIANTGSSLNDHIDLNASITVNGNLTFTSGKIDLQSNTLDNNNLTLIGSVTGFNANKYIIAGGNSYNDGGGRFIKFVSSSNSSAGSPQVFPLGTSTSYTPCYIYNSNGTGTNFKINLFEPVMKNGTEGSVITSNVVKRTWDIVPENASYANITLKLEWAAGDEFSDFSRNIATVWKNHHQNSTDLYVMETGTLTRGTDATTTLFFAQVTGITSFSNFTVGENLGLLPVELLGFEAVCNDKKVDLSWSTASETNNDYFTIERSQDAMTWEVVANVAGSGNSNTVTSYTYNDEGADVNTIYYRLKQTDYDGLYEYFDPITIKCDDINRQINLYPNPASNLTTCSIYSNVQEMAILEVTNCLGTVVFSQKHKILDGFSTVSINVSNYQSGFYYVILRSLDGTVIGNKQLIVN